ncbi:hypothetical protein Unana1_01586 [Umbelopsis nana]
MNALGFRYSTCLLSSPHVKVGIAQHCQKVLPFRQARSISTEAYASLRNDPAVIDRCFHLSDAFTEQASIKRYRVDDFLVYPGFVSNQEHDRIADICEKKLKRALGRQVEYHQQHFDTVIHRYRECSASHWGKQDEYMTDFIKSRIYSTFPDQFEWIEPHILDLDAGGEIRAHIDNVEYSGSVVAGLCLLSPAIMTLRHKDDSNIRLDVLLEPGTFYIQRWVLHIARMKLLKGRISVLTT